MKIFGDVSEHEISTADGLSRMEAKLVQSKKMSKVHQAKGYAYIIAHWYILGMDEEGNRLLKKIEEICPEYFRKHIKKDMEKDPKFHDLMVDLFVEFAFCLTNKPDIWMPRK